MRLQNYQIYPQDNHTLSSSEEYKMLTRHLNLEEHYLLHNDMLHTGSNFLILLLQQLLYSFLCSKYVFLLVLVEKRFLQMFLCFYYSHLKIHLINYLYNHLYILVYKIIIIIIPVYTCNSIFIIDMKISTHTAKQA